MLYELREYIAVPGRFQAVVERFQTCSIPLFAKYEMGLVYLGSTSLGENSFNELVYALRFEDAADMERKWAAFLGDPEWAAAVASSEADGPLIETLKRRLIDPGDLVEG